MGTVCGDLLGERGLLSDFCSLSEHISQNVQKLNKIIFSLQLNLKKKKNFFCRCIARPLISVDVSLHSNKKEKSKTCVFECCFQGLLLSSCCQSQAGVGSVALCRRVALKHLQLHMFP